MIPFDFGVSRSKVKVTMTWSIKSLSVQNLKPITDTIIGILVGHDTEMISIDVWVSRSMDNTITNEPSCAGSKVKVACLVKYLDLWKIIHGKYKIIVHTCCTWDNAIQSFIEGFFEVQNANFCIGCFISWMSFSAIMEQKTPMINNNKFSVITSRLMSDYVWYAFGSKLD